MFIQKNNPRAVESGSIGLLATRADISVLIER